MTSGGHLTTVTDPAGKAARVSYNLAGQPAQTIQPNGSTVDYAYDKAGRLAVTKSSLGATTSFAYDEASRVTQVTVLHTCGYSKVSPTATVQRCERGKGDSEYLGKAPSKHAVCLSLQALESCRAASSLSGRPRRLKFVTRNEVIERSVSHNPTLCVFISHGWVFPGGTHIGGRCSAVRGASPTDCHVLFRDQRPFRR